MLLFHSFFFLLLILFFSLFFLYLNFFSLFLLLLSPFFILFPQILDFLQLLFLPGLFLSQLWQLKISPFDVGLLQEPNSPLQEVPIGCGVIIGLYCYDSPGAFWSQDFPALLSLESENDIEFLSWFLWSLGPISKIRAIGVHVLWLLPCPTL